MQGKWNAQKDLASVMLLGYLLVLILILFANLWLQPSQPGMAVPDSPEVVRIVVPDGPE